MTEFMDYTPLQYWRDYNTDGVPSSGDYPPDKLNIREFQNSMWQRSKGGWITPRDFRATAGQGSLATDQAALAAWAADPSPWKLLDRQYLSSAEIVLPANDSTQIFGLGSTSCGITMTNVGQNGIVKPVGSGSLGVDNISMSTSVDKTAGTAIKATGGALGHVRGCRISGVSNVLRLWNGIEMDCLIPTVEANYFLLCRNVSTHVHNSNPTTGGSEANVINNWYNSGILNSVGTVACLWNNGGGPFQFSGNRIQNMDFCFNAFLDGTGVGGGVFARGNMIASCRTMAFNFVPAGAAAAIDFVDIDDNFFNMSGAGKALNIAVGSASSGAWMQRWSFTNNKSLLNQAGFVTTTAGIVGTMHGNEWHGAADVVPVNVGLYTTGGAGGRIKDNDLKYNITTLATLNGNVNWSQAA